jgi:predicted ester cyclase
MTGGDGKATVRSYFEEFLTRGNLDTADAIFMPGVRFHYPLGELGGVEAIKSYIIGFRGAFPDVRFTVEDLFGDSDRIAARWRLTGTQTGTFRGGPPTGKHVTVAGNTIFSVQNGRILEMWVAFDPAPFS